MSGTIYTGSSADGSDAYPVEGMYVSPDGNEWSNQPYTEEDRMWNKIYHHLAKNLRSLQDEHELIKQKNSGLSSRLRSYVIQLIENTKDEKTNTKSAD